MLLVWSRFWSFLVVEDLLPMATEQINDSKSNSLGKLPSLQQIFNFLCVQISELIQKLMFFKFPKKLFKNLKLSLTISNNFKAPFEMDALLIYYQYNNKKKRIIYFSCNPIYYIRCFIKSLLRGNLQKEH